MFKDPISKNYITQSLFFETARNKDFIMFTLKDEDYQPEGYEFKLPSLKKLYMQCADPTEYIFATTYLGGWEHWQRIYNNKLFTEMIDNWRYELELSIRSQALRQVVDFSNTDKGFQAAKLLMEGGWKDKKRGAPSKQEKARELKMQSDMAAQINDDLERLRH